MRAALAVAIVLGVAAPTLAAERPPETFAPIVEAVKSSVLSVVHAHETVPDELDAEGLLGGLFDALTRVPNQTLGAAVIVDQSGVAVTGARLLRGLTDVAVLDVTGRRTSAVVVARDDRTDIALLRLMGAGPFPAVAFGNSDEVRVGDWVLAIGSPYGFEASVSAGVISARPRSGPSGPWDDLLQTDAAINPGSAGGPLLNAHGEVIGLAAVAAPRGSGIGFAVSSNVVRRVVGDLLAHGRVVRSWLGVESQPMTAELARGFRIPLARGLLLTDVAPGSPAAAAGLVRGSVVVSFDGRPVREVADLEAALARLPPGRTVALGVWRKTTQETVQAVLTQEPRSLPRDRGLRWRGLVLEPITPEVGVTVGAVELGGPALRSGILRGDIVLELAQRTIRTLADVEAATEGTGRDETVMLLIQRGHTPLYFAISP